MLKITNTRAELAALNAALSVGDVWIINRSSQYQMMYTIDEINPADKANDLPFDNSANNASPVTVQAKPMAEIYAGLPLKRERTSQLMSAAQSRILFQIVIHNTNRDTIVTDTGRRVKYSLRVFMEKLSFDYFVISSASEKFCLVAGRISPFGRNDRKGGLLWNDRL
jgi:hypothetical protein